MSIRALIVDDEPLARQRIRKLLAEEKDIECAGECGDGRSAVEAILREAPDLVFLDVQMPEMDGFGVLREIQPHRLPAVVFVTAYDSYALKAFEVHALDYLLKPFDRDRFREALSRARAVLLQRSDGEIDQRLLALLRSVGAPAGGVERFVVKLGGRVFFVKADDVDWIEAAGNYLRLHSGKEEYLVRETMNNVETRLDTKKFIRVHRSAIVNIDRIKEMRPWFHGEYVIVLKNGAELTLSRGYRENLREILGEPV